MVDVSRGNHQTRFVYGPERNRYKRTDFDHDKDSHKVTYYLGNVELTDFISGERAGEREYKRYVGDMIETIYYDANDQFVKDERHYQLQDHLGSVDVITDEEAQVVQELSFDAWGQRRDCLLYTSPSPRDQRGSRMPSSA